MLHNALHCVAFALTLVGMKCNARIDSLDPILAFLCVEFLCQIVKKLLNYSSARPYSTFWTWLITPLYVQWNLWTKDNLGPAVYVLNREVFLFQRFTLHWKYSLGQEILSFIERFLYCVLNTESHFLEAPLYIYLSLGSDLLISCFIRCLSQIRKGYLY